LAIIRAKFNAGKRQVKRMIPDKTSLFIQTVRRQWTPPEDLRRLQEAKLRRLVRHAYDWVDYYRDLLNSAGLKPVDIQSLDDLGKIPTT
jgi:phenylacetate-CoA ligase